MTEVRPSSEPPGSHVAYRAVLLAAALLVFGLVFRQLLTLMLAVLITVVIAIPLAACATRLERRGVPRAVGALAGLLTGLAVVGVLIYLLIPPFIDETNQFVDDVPGIVDNLRDQIHDVTGAKPGEIGDRVQDFAQRYTDDPAKLIGPITAIGLNVAGVLGALVLMLITAFYMAVRPEPLVEGMLRLLPPDRRAHGRFVLERLRRAWIGWMQGVAVDMFLTGLLLYIGLRVVGLDFAIFFAVLSAILCLIPYFGSIAGAIPPTLFAVTDSPGKALLVLGVYVLVQQIESNLTIPIVMAQTVRLHPAVIAIGVVVVGQLVGVLGLFVAVPILSLVVIGVEEFWVKPLEEAHRKRGSPVTGERALGEDEPKPVEEKLELDDRDDGGGQAADQGDDLHGDPEAGHGYGVPPRATR
jgi:predicted PurR-regulated permease PerM